MVYIYGLACPQSGRIRYIGKSDNPSKRLRAHISAAVRRAYDHHTARWIRRLVAVGKAPELVILCAVQDGEDWREVERGWIAKAKAEGWPITNTTAGGEGLDYIDPIEEAKWRANWNRSMEAYRATAEYRENYARFVASSQTPEAKEKRRASLLETWSDADRIERLKASITEAQNRPSTKAKRSRWSKGFWAANHDQQVEKMWTPEARERHKEARVAAWADPVVGAKLRAIHASPEVRAKKAEGALRRATPEYRAVMAERTRLSWEKRRKTKGA